MSRAGSLTIAEPWRDALAAAGLDSFEALMATSAGKCLSRHTRGEAWRLTLPDGREVFLKRDLRTMGKQIAADLMVGRRPEPLTVRERQGLALASAAGVRTARPIAWGQRRRWGLPHQGVLLMTALPGQPLEAFLADCGKEATRLAVLRAVGLAVGRLGRAGLSWPDLLPKHVYVDEAGAIGLLDLERLRATWRGAIELRRQARRFEGLLRRVGLESAGLESFRAALAEALAADPTDRVRGA